LHQEGRALRFLPAPLQLIISGWPDIATRHPQIRHIQLTVRIQFEPSSNLDIFLHCLMDRASVDDMGVCSDQPQRDHRISDAYRQISDDLMFALRGGGTMQCHNHANSLHLFLRALQGVSVISQPSSQTLKTSLMNPFNSFEHASQLLDTRHVCMRGQGGG
jgi:hypothetical protein